MFRLGPQAPMFIVLFIGLFAGCALQTPLGLPDGVAAAPGPSDAATSRTLRRSRLPFPAQEGFWGLRMVSGAIVPYTLDLKLGGSGASQYVTVADAEADFLFTLSRFLQFDARSGTTLCLLGAAFASLDDIDPSACQAFGPWVQFALNGGGLDIGNDSEGVGKGVVVHTPDDVRYVLRIVAIGTGSNNPEGGVLVEYRAQP